MKILFDPRCAVVIYIPVFIACFLIQFFFDELFAEYSNWSWSSGWQTEIALHALVYVLLFFIFLIKLKGNEYLIVMAVTFMSVLMGTNHFLSILQQDLRLSNLIGFLANFTSIVYGSIVLHLYYKGRTNKAV